MTPRDWPKNYHAEEGEWIPHGSKMMWQCCDCGLIHDVEFRLGDDGRLEVRMFRKQNSVESKETRQPK